MPLFYADASALVKLVRDEPESGADAVALLPLDRGMLAAAGSLAEPALRALDLIGQQ